MATSLLPASFRGVPFAVRTDGLQGGRRLAEHEYPGRDGLFPEDMGRQGRRYRIQGFLTTDAAYGGGDIAIQRQAFIAAAELEGPAPLIHPSLGALTVSCRSYAVNSDLSAATSAEIELEVVEYTLQLFPLLSSSTVDVVAAAALGVDGAAAAAFAGSAIAGQASSAAAAQWCAAITASGQDATALTNLAAQLPGPYGRFFAGGNAGYLSSSVYAGDTTVAELVTDAASARSALGATSIAVASDYTALVPTSASGAAGDVQALIAALQAACADPADALRLLASVAATVPTNVVAVDDVFRRAAVTAAARTACAYQPTSQTDAQAVQGQVTGLIDNELEVAGNEGADGCYQAFKTLRQAVVADLQARGGALAPLQEFTFAASLPALTLAERLYGDATRADQLISETDPVNPLFMPVQFQALAA